MASLLIRPNIKIVLFSMLLHFGSWSNAWSQTNIWTENFTNGCSANCLATTYGGWSVVDNVDGTTGSAPNNWFVSCAEEGIMPPGCGSACIGDASLHIGLNPGAGGDASASYNETGVSNATYRLAVSPTISTVGKTGITLQFDYIAFGSASCSEDHAELRLSSDGGSTWPVAYQYCLTSPCCGACNGYSSGQWTTYSMVLPAVFENNPNLRIGFHWRNNGNGVGTDPSVAIDDIRLSVPVLPLDLVDFTARPEYKKVKLSWTSTDETGLSHFEVERSGDAKAFKKINQVAAKGNDQKTKNYYTLEDAPVETPTLYYRLKMVDKDGRFKYSPIINVTTESANTASLAFGNLASGDKFLQLQLTTPTELIARVDLYDLQGKKLVSLNQKNYPKGQNTITLDVSKLKSSVYIINVKSDDNQVDISKKFFKAK